MCCSRAFRFLALLTSSAFRGFDHAGHSVRFVASMMLRTVLRTDCSRFRLFLCVCVCSNAATTIAISMAHAGAHALASLKPQQKCQVEQGQKNRVRCIYIYGYFVRFVANMMLRTVLRADCSRFWLFLCVCSNAATSIAISMAHQVHMHSLH